MPGSLPALPHVVVAWPAVAARWSAFPRMEAGVWCIVGFTVVILTITVVTRLVDCFFTRHARRISSDDITCGQKKTSQNKQQQKWEQSLW